MAETKAKKW
ncbi:unnamed protein product [Oppiella nova]|uniref:Uncharacterized protein n=1 Tax=Oppiella nova TaxID=334625 RepID=A0A7R9ML42_9ACAR|nr:unnamed protein product [Oppiella nova]CAD7662237.1 unnamed protein product [Oppiella nova]CAG2179289.1 unnamed protein product [Oppiella nova]CAG2179373.1 unnamed protein product [Oppiella nova]